MPADHFIEVYQRHADLYDAMVKREDYQGNLLPALFGAAPLKGAFVVELGAGTGRLTRLLTPHAASVAAFDMSAHMLRTAAATLPKGGAWSLGVADNAHLPLRAGVADVVLAGWSLGHATGWYPDTWRDVIGAALREMRRVLKPDGVAVILETMGTGYTEAVPTNDTLAAYYAWLEGEWGFTRQVIRTDYHFASVDEADRLTRFFFGDALADRIRAESLTMLTEHTGVWSRQGTG